VEEVDVDVEDSAGVEDAGEAASVVALIVMVIAAILAADRETVVLIVVTIVAVTTRDHETITRRTQLLSCTVRALCS